MTKDQKGLGKILKESLSFYGRNILRLIEIPSWVSLPATILFVLLFFWGLEESHIYILMGIFFVVCLLIVLLLLIVSIKTIETLDKGRPLKTLTVYAETFELFFPSVRLWILLTVKILLWSLLLIIPGFIFMLFYHFSLMALLVDGKTGKEALLTSKQLVQSNFWKFLRALVLILILMAPFCVMIYCWAGIVYGIPLLPENLFLLIFNACLLNFFTVVINIFPVVFFYFVYKEFGYNPKRSM